MPAPLANSTYGGSWAEAHYRPAATEESAAHQNAAHVHGLVAQGNNFGAGEKLNSNHADEYGRQHELHDRHVSQQQSANLFIETYDAALLQEKPEQYAGNQTQYLIDAHDALLRYTSPATTVPAPKNIASATNELTDSCIM